MRKDAAGWVGAYYPNSTIDNSRSKAILCLLFDKIICHFPVNDMAHGGGHGLSEFFSDSLLIEEDVIELREEKLRDDVKMDFSSGQLWGTDDEFNQYCDLQVTSMALNVCTQLPAVPVTDDVNCSIPISLIKGIDLMRATHIQAAAIALRSLEITLPPLANVSDEDILKARNDLKEQLLPFRYAMLLLAPLVRNGINSDTSVEEIFKEAKYVVETKVSPALYDLSRKMSQEKSKFLRRLLVQGSTFLPKLILNWTTKDTVTATISSLEETRDIALQVMNHNMSAASIAQSGGLGYLLSVRKHPIFKSRE